MGPGKNTFIILLLLVRLRGFLATFPHKFPLQASVTPQVRFHIALPRTFPQVSRKFSRKSVGGIGSGTRINSTL